MEQTHIRVSSLIRSVIGSAGALAMAEIGLLGAEMRGKMKAGLTPVIMAGAAASLLLTGSFVFSIALVLVLVHLEMAPHLAALAVAAAFLLAGAGLLMAALSGLRKLDLTPARTLAQLREDLNILKEPPHG